MQEMDDIGLLQEFAQNGSQAAFTTLVERRAGLVYSAALRQVRDPYVAEDVTQAVFILLAQKASSISDNAHLTGWLFKTTRFAALAEIRASARRQKQAAELQMQSELRHSGPDPAWEQMAPLLDEALSNLREKDRQAVLLRFFENKSLVEVGTCLGTNHNTAGRRVTRALEKLRQSFLKRGIAATTAVIAGAISTHAVHAAPAGLCISTVTAATGSAGTASTLTLVKGTIKLMAWTKVKMAAVIGVGVLLAAGTTTLTVKKIHQRASEEWQLAAIDSAILHKVPPQTAILPTLSKKRSAKAGPGGMSWNANGLVVGINTPVETIIRVAYFGYGSVSPARLALRTKLPTGNYDFISNLPTGSKKQLQQEITKQFAVTGKFETIETNVLFLKVKDSNSSGLKPSTAKMGLTRNGNGEISCTKASLDDLAVQFEGMGFKVPVINQTGLTNDFDFTIRWHEYGQKVGDRYPDYPNLDGLKEALTEQLGLELVPGIAPVQMLVVERGKQ